MTVGDRRVGEATLKDGERGVVEFEIDMGFKSKVIRTRKADDTKNVSFVL
jgi:hypothetical protein